MPTLLAATCTTVPADADAATGAALPAVLGAGLPVPVVDGTTVPHANLDLAASAPALQCVADRVAALLPYHASVHRGAGYASQVCTAALEAARRTVGRFVGARADDVVVFTRNTTDALNLLAGAVPGSVLCLDVEHHANLLAWRGGSHRILRAAATVDATLTDLRDALADTPTALVAVTGASNVTGEVLPLAEIARITHEAGARIVVDAAQLAPHRRVDIESAGIDYVALSGHKLYAPFGSGALVGRRDWLDVATPYLAGGGAVQRVTAAGAGTAAEVSWAPAPHRHEAGTPTCPAPSRSPRPAMPSTPASTTPSPRSAHCPTGSPPGSSPAPGCARCASGTTPPTASASTPSSSTATRRVSSPPTCRPSTASRCATASSARTRWSIG